MLEQRRFNVEFVDCPQVWTVPLAALRGGGPVTDDRLAEVAGRSCSTESRMERQW